MILDDARSDSASSHTRSSTVQSPRSDESARPRVDLRRTLDASLSLAARHGTLSTRLSAHLTCAQAPRKKRVASDDEDEGYAAPTQAKKKPAAKKRKSAAARGSDGSDDDGRAKKTKPKVAKFTDDVRRWAG